jgi:polyisoprenoid-binding protein YceI
MKTIFIIIILVVAGYFGWQAIQTKPSADVPQAVVTNESELKTLDTDSNLASGGSSQKALEVINELVAISFKGFGPGKVHNGSFSKISSSLAYDSGAFAGDVVIDMTSLSSDNEKLTTHLKSKDFFDVAKYSTATFTPKSWDISKSDQDLFTMTGDMTIKGVKKSITFPIKYEEIIPSPNVKMAYTKSYKGTFTLNMKDFGINQAFANETVELSIVVPLN